MAKPKVLILTSVGIKLTEKGLERVKKEEEYEDEDNPVEGSSAWFRKMGLEPPKDLEEKENKLLDSEFEEDEFYYVYGEVVLDLDSYEYLSYSEDTKVTYIHVKSGKIIPVLETAEQVYEQIYDLKSNFFERLIDKIKLKLTKTNE